MEEQNIKEQRIRKITQMYYTRKDIQKALFEFSKNREIAPSYMMESFGKRPDSFQYPRDVFELVKNRATSFHCSEELWEDPLKLSTEMNEKQLDELRIGWDLLFDIDSKYLDYSKILAEIIIKVLKFYGVKNVGIKYSGSKGFHMIVPWKAFPKEINNIRTSDMFPEWPRILTQFIMEASEKELIEKITLLTTSGLSKYVKDFEAPKDVMPDLILVSPRHLFRMPYSLHEKTALASMVIIPEKFKDFQPKDADPLKVKVRDFIPEAVEGEASELLREALDWYKMKKPDEIRKTEKTEFKPIQISDFSEEIFPPTIKRILQGLKDGRKRSLFVLINLFRSMGMNKDELEKRIYEWNEKNTIPLKKGYIKSQLSWSYRNKIVPPPNYDKDHYKGIGIIPTEEELRYKNPISYIAKKSRQKNIQDKPKRQIKKYKRN
ncbi:hypothetical protein ES703_04081 [subsurface metagenome]